MPFRSTRTRRQHYNPVADKHLSKDDSRMFDSSYLVEDSNGEKWVYAGLVVAVDDSTSKYVPYSAGASYGTGSDTPVGVTMEPYDMQLGAKAVATAWHGRFIEDYCYVFGSAMGTIPSAVKTALDNIKWT